MSVSLSPLIESLFNVRKIDIFFKQVIELITRERKRGVSEVLHSNKDTDTAKNIFIYFLFVIFMNIIFINNQN